MSQPETDIAPLRASDIAAAIGLLTRLPVQVSDRAATRGARAAWAYPLAGLVVGGLAGSVAWAALALGLAPMLAAGLALAAQVVATGALHEDGLADCADGFWGGWTRERRLEIMKDSHIGTYGVLALLLVTGLRWGALAMLFAQGWVFAPLIVAAMASRAAMVGPMALLPHARATGLAHHVGRAPGVAAGLAGALALLGALLLAGPVTGLACGVTAALVALGLTRLARARIGGQTGDVLGATQQIAETALLLTLSA